MRNKSFRPFLMVLVLAFLCKVESGKFGGFSRSSGRVSKPSYSSSSRVHRPASLSYPTHSSPSHSNSRPIGFQHPSPSHSAPSYGFKPSHTASAPPVSSAPNYGFKPAHSGASAPPAEHTPTHQKSLQSGAPSAPVGTPAYGFNPSNSADRNQHGSPPGYGFKPNVAGPVGQPTAVKPVGNAAAPGAPPYSVHPPPYTPHNPGVAPPPYTPHGQTAYHPSGNIPPPAYNPAGYGAPPPYHPGGYGAPHGAYPQQQYYPGGYHSGAAPGVTNININNNVNSHHTSGYGGGYGGGFGGFGGYSAPSYSYTAANVGSGAIGFFLGYSLAKITTPTFQSSPAFYDGYRPRYDHYEVHHYYHNKDSVPTQSTIQPNAIVGCIGDSGTICPTGTTSLCTSNGAILCVASASSTVPCTDQQNVNCVKTVIPCVNGTGCVEGQNKTVTLPCISKAQVPGNITYVNNTIIVNNTTIVNNNFVNGTTTVTPNVMVNGTDSTTLPPNITTDGVRSKRAAEVVNEFCVTILALPAEKKPSEQQEILDSGVGIFSKFLVKALGAQ